MFNKIEPLILKQQRLTILVKLLIVMSVACLIGCLITMATVMSIWFLGAAIVSVLTILWCRNRVDQYTQEIHDLRDAMKHTDLPPATIELIEGREEQVAKPDELVQTQGVDVAAQLQNENMVELLDEASVMELSEVKDIQSIEESDELSQLVDTLVEDVLAADNVESIISEVTEDELVTDVMTTVELNHETDEEKITECQTNEMKSLDELMVEQIKLIVDNHALTTKKVGKYLDVKSEHAKIRLKLTGRKKYVLTFLTEEEIEALAVMSEIPAKTEKFTTRVMVSDPSDLEPLTPYLQSILSR